jgi:hypothetical protein
MPSGTGATRTRRRSCGSRGRVGRRPIPKGHAVPYRRSAAGDIIGRGGAASRVARTAPDDRTGQPLNYASREPPVAIQSLRRSASALSDHWRPTVKSQVRRRIHRSSSAVNYAGRVRDVLRHLSRRPGFEPRLSVAEAPPVRTESGPRCLSASTIARADRASRLTQPLAAKCDRKQRFAHSPPPLAQQRLIAGGSRHAPPSSCHAE